MLLMLFVEPLMCYCSYNTIASTTNKSCSVASLEESFFNILFPIDTDAIFLFCDLLFIHYLTVANNIMGELRSAVCMLTNRTGYISFTFN